MAGENEFKHQMTPKKRGEIKKRRGLPRERTAAVRHGKADHRDSRKREEADMNRGVVTEIEEGWW